MPLGERPYWQLPPGITRGMWEYAQADHIARDYDEYFAYNRLFQFDEEVLARHFTQPGLVVDLGCGTGRALVPLARRGFRGMGVDLSLEMLDVVGEKAAAEQLPIERVLANLVQLDCLADGCADYCICLFSTLGMIRGRENRQIVLQHARRILKPGGVFVLHVHNLWHYLFDGLGRRWLALHLPDVLRGRAELGDKFFDYRRIPNMFLHVFTRREVRSSLRQAGFTLRELIHLDVTRHRELRRPWLLGGLRQWLDRRGGVNPTE